MTTLVSLLKSSKTGQIIGDGEIEIRGISYDSRKVLPGDIFACLPGSKVDGHSYIPAVLAAGAAALLVSDALQVPAGVPAIVTADTRETLAEISAEFYGHPADSLTLVGVTGTNGKTTVTTLLWHILQAAGKGCGLLGTMAYHIGDTVLPAPHTTPQAPDLQRLLAQMRDVGLSHVVMEISSHALCLHRVAECHFDLSLLTNITQDHLDFHLTWEAYRDAKLQLFTDPRYQPRHRAMRCLLNQDDPSADYFTKNALGEVRHFGLASGDYHTSNLSLRADSSSFNLDYPDGNAEVTMQLVGSFNVSNALAALAVALELGVDILTATRALAAIPPVNGRFQRVAESGNGKPTVIVDYAHTPDGLEKVLSTAAEIAPNKVTVVFGCGGNRDRGKRPLMAAAAAKWAQKIIVTSDNPRDEAPATIIEDIMAGFNIESLRRVVVEPDRASAIRLAIQQAAADQLIILAGKGHEDYQLFANGEKIHFDDREEAIKALGDYKT